MSQKEGSAPRGPPSCDDSGEPLPAGCLSKERAPLCSNMSGAEQRGRGRAASPLSESGCLRSPCSIISAPQSASDPSALASPASTALSSCSALPAQPLPFEAEAARALLRRGTEEGGSFWSSGAVRWSATCARNGETGGSAKKRRSAQMTEDSSPSSNGEDALSLKCVNHLVLLRRVYGRGTYGKVTAALDLADNLRPLAVKTYFPEALRRSRTAAFGPNGPRFLTEWDKVRAELLVQSSLRHRHICPLYGVVDDTERGEFRLLLQFLPHALMTWSETAQAFHVVSPGDATTRHARALAKETAEREITVYTEDAAREVFAQLLDAVDYLHSLGVVHKDIKPQNILAVSPPPSEWLVSLSLPPGAPASGRPQSAGLVGVPGPGGDREEDDGLLRSSSFASDDEELDDEDFFEDDEQSAVAFSPAFAAAADAAAGRLAPYEAYASQTARRRLSCCSATSGGGCHSHEEEACSLQQSSPGNSTSAAASTLSPRCCSSSPSSACLSRLVAAAPSSSSVCDGGAVPPESSLSSSSPTRPRKRRSGSACDERACSLLSQGRDIFKRTVGSCDTTCSLAAAVFLGEEAALLRTRGQAKSIPVEPVRDDASANTGPQTQTASSPSLGGKEHLQDGGKPLATGEAGTDPSSESVWRAAERGQSAAMFADLSDYRDFLSWNGTVDLEAERTKCVWKLVDFNSATVATGERVSIWDSEGTRLFTPPECLGVAQDGGCDGRSRDLWSLGVCLYCLLLGRPPFYAGGDTGLALVAAIMSEDIVFPEYRHVSEDVKDLLRGLLSKDPRTRLTSEQARAHPWMMMSR
ncbi:atypical MEK-related kinase (incomplete catalytic triad) [Besnoitia besnoiti]|uniref:Atypical MEK-related kinase (Incomplete catalytic triad) n=1 Tax=Besnoitia besnoiti TaxID=94643 RepID=A0A2A9MLV7_BESBE|nr:atypical MEK-related kinase (incomplete catalytic triad) [Besnoitia besnoiti]PFH36462.1 atypical MEK-related kinase (incomplete catalytic triad) [Besnoitia besnoiti]